MKQLTKSKIKLLKLLIILAFLLLIDVALLIWTVCDTKFEFLPTPLRTCLMIFSSVLFPSLVECVIMVIKKMSDKNT